MLGLPLAHYAIADAGFGLSDPLFVLHGSSDAEFSATTDFIELIESGRGHMAFVVKIELRSLTQ